MEPSPVLQGQDKWQSFLKELTTTAFLVGPLCEKEPRSSGPAIFVDGGAQWYREPGISVGDGDSWNDGLQVQLNPQKDVSDLGFVLRSLPDSVRLLEMCGFLGGDRDHELFNLGEVQRFLNLRPRRVAHLDTSVLGFSRGNWQLEHEGEFSLLSLAPVSVSLHGDVQYPLSEPAIIEPLDSRGLSNVGSGLISLQSTGTVFIFLR